MLSQSLWKTFIILSICFIGIIFALPNILTPQRLESLPSWFPKHTVNLGLDLQGGSHLLLEVDLKTGLHDRLNFVLEGVRKALRSEKIGYLDLSLKDESVTFKLRKLEQAPKAQEIISKTDPDLEINLQGEMVTVRFSPSTLRERKNHIIDQSIEIVRRRIDEIGTREPLIQRQGEDRILLQLPGVENPGHIKELLGKTAKMSFMLLDKDIPEVPSPQASTPPGTEILPGDGKADAQEAYYVVRKEVLLGGENLVDAGVQFDEYQRPKVSFRFDSFGSSRFGEITSKNIGRRLAIVLDNKVISAPRINSTIHGSGVIEGNFTLKEANDLALLMRAGALVAPLTVLEERTVGPDLGADSIQAGQHATILSIIMVAIFMVIAYSLFGLIANIAMVFNLILLISALSLIGATLTLPGIAGIALTMGMAVDANVLINERIKEELRLGRRMVQAIDAGYRRAMATIVDSNVTTLIGAGALFFFGTGPVKGFGVTLSLGIIVSMFTAITLSRLIVIYWLKWFKPKTLAI
jgi:preprotein translocase subunit SecD